MARKVFPERATGFQITLTQTLLDELEKLALTGVFGATVQDVIETLCSQEVRRLVTSGDLAKLLERIRIYPDKEAEDGGKKESP